MRKFLLTCHAARWAENSAMYLYIAITLSIFALGVWLFGSGTEAM
jgi:hypothetical protein